MADPGLVKRMVEDGWDRQAATDNLDALGAVILAQLEAGKSVSIDGVARLVAKPKIVKVNMPLDHLRRRTQVKLAKGAILADGEPFPDPNVQPKKRSTYGGGR